MALSTSAEVVRCSCVEQVVEAAGSHRFLHVVGAGTKTTMASAHPDAVQLDLSALSGVVDHQPSEFLITALAGTPLRDLDAALALHGQYLPFDPPLVSRGATIGGTVAAGLSGPGRLRYGGLRDFLMAIRLVDGQANLVFGGGKVVKNAAGYDLPKLMIGSAGYFGAIVEVTLKVFPRPKAEATFAVTTASFESAARLQSQLVRSPLEWTAIDLSGGGNIWVRVSGEPDAISVIERRAVEIIAACDPVARMTVVDEPTSIWRSIEDGSWAGEDRWVRVALAPSKLLAVENSLVEAVVPRRYSAAGNLLWIAWPMERPIGQLDDLLRYHELGGTVLRGDASRYRIGVRPSAAMVRRVKQSLDPGNRWAGCP